MMAPQTCSPIPGQQQHLAHLGCMHCFLATLAKAAWGDFFLLLLPFATLLMMIVQVSHSFISFLLRTITNLPATFSAAWMVARSSPAALGGIHGSTRHGGNVTASVCLHRLTTGICVHRLQTELLWASAGLCLHPAISRHLEKAAGSEEGSPANGPFSPLTVMRWIRSAGWPLPPVFCLVSVRPQASL